MNSKISHLLGLSLLSSSIIMTNYAAFANEINYDIKPFTMAKAENQNVIEHDNFRVNLKGCFRRNKLVTCSMLVTNLGEKNRIFQFNRRSNYSPRVFDFSGNEYTVTSIQVGKSNTATYNSKNARTKLIPGVPTLTSATFKLPQNVNKLAAFEINYFAYPGGNNKVDFRNVIITGASQANSK